MTLLDLADISFHEYARSAEEEADEQFEKKCESFLSAARAIAHARFGSSSSELEWTYSAQTDLPTDVEQATAPLAAGRTEYLRYRYDHASEDTTFELVQPCTSCGHDEINEVTSLVGLGRLLELRKGGAA